MSFRGQPTNKLERSPWSRMKPLSTSSDSVQTEIPPLSLPLQELGFHVMYIILYYIYIYKPNSTPPPPDVPLQGLGWRPSTYIIYIYAYIYIYIYICIYIYIVCVCVCLSPGAGGDGHLSGRVSHPRNVAISEARSEPKKWIDGFFSSKNSR